MIFLLFCGFIFCFMGIFAFYYMLCLNENKPDITS